MKPSNQDHGCLSRFRYPNGATDPAAAYVAEYRPY
jgi:hypothetical protein